MSKKNPLGMVPLSKDVTSSDVCNQGNHRNARQDAARLKMVSSFKSNHGWKHTHYVSCVGKRVANMCLVTACNIETLLILIDRNMTMYDSAEMLHTECDAALWFRASMTYHQAVINRCCFYYYHGYYHYQ